jgi:hypothetical protein
VYVIIYLIIDGGVIVGLLFNMDLRAPLPPEYCNHDDQLQHSSLESLIQYLLCRLYLASQVMELGSESRFASIIIFRRYCCCFNKILYQSWQKQQIDQKDKNSTHDLIPTNQELRQIKRHLGRIAAACLFLGCKAEEEPRRIRDVINLSSILDFEDIGGDGSPQSKDNNGDLIDTSLEQSATKEPLVITESQHPPPLDDKYWSDKENMVSTEQQLLRMLQFDTLVSNPYRCVLVIMETLNFCQGTTRDHNNRNHNSLLSPRASEALIFRAWTLLNEISIDAVYGAIILRVPVVTLACAVISVAAAAANRNNGVKNLLPDEWWRALDVSTNELSSTVENINNLIHKRGDTPISVSAV